MCNPTYKVSGSSRTAYMLLGVDPTLRPGRRRHYGGTACRWALRGRWERRPISLAAVGAHLLRIGEGAQIAEVLKPAPPLRHCTWLNNRQFLADVGVGRAGIRGCCASEVCGSVCSIGAWRCGAGWPWGRSGELACE